MVSPDVFEAEQIERTDVVTAYEKDQYLWSGYRVKVPKDIFWAANDVVLSGTTKMGEQVVFYEFIPKDGKDNLDN